MPGLRVWEPTYDGRPVMVTGTDYRLGLYNGDLGVVRLLGDGRFTEVVIDPETVRRYPVEDVCALVLEAVNDGLRRLNEASQATFAPLIAEAGS